jgi:ribonuclease III
MPSTTSSPVSERGGAVDTSHDEPALLEDRLGYRFTDPSLLELALRHRSWCAEHDGLPSNERLEFLGDAVLGVVVTDHLYRSSPDTSEGVLARRRSELVSASALAAMARAIGLGPAIRLGKGEAGTGGSDKTSILADAMEAVLGAVYLDGGFSAATRVVLSLSQDRITGVVTGGLTSDHKSRLQELAAQVFGDLPRYDLSESGPEHAKEFRAVVVLDGRPWGRGAGRTKKEAEQAAAREACERVADLVTREDGEGTGLEAGTTVAEGATGTVAGPTGRDHA